MFSSIASLIALALVFAVVVGGYASARRFVRDRLRYVDAVHRPTTPWIAAGGAWVLGMFAAFLLPFVGPFAALSFGLSVGLGVAAGVRDIKRGSYTITDGR